MNWTRSKPTVDGWYWYRMYDDDLVEVVCVEGDEIVMSGEELWTDINHGDASWYGPITAPEGLAEVDAEPEPTESIMWFVDLINGKDTNDGLTPETAITHNEALRRAGNGVLYVELPDE